MSESRPCMLCVYAHPDDEVFSIGGTIAKLSERGVHIVLALATGGEAGEVVNPELRESVPLIDLPRIRQEELECSRRTLGIAEIIRLGYRDSGMADAPSNDSGAFVAADKDQVVGRVVQLIRRLHPQVVCTFAPDGGYGHPDHIRVNVAALLAFDRAGDPSWYPDAGPPWQPVKLYYPVLAQRMIRDARSAMTRRGLPFNFGGSLSSVNDDRDFGVPDDQISTVVDISTTLDRKVAAFRCYATQNRPDFFYYTVPPEVAQEALARESFILARSHIEVQTPEADLFDGVDVP